MPTEQQIPACNCGSNVDGSWHKKGCPIYDLDHPEQKASDTERTIQRYEYLEGLGVLQEGPHGLWVAYEDHLSALQKEKAEREAVEQNVETLRGLTKAAVLLEEELRAAVEAAAKRFEDLAAQAEAVGEQITANTEPMGDPEAHRRAISVEVGRCSAYRSAAEILRALTDEPNREESSS